MVVIWFVLTLVLSMGSFEDMEDITLQDASVATFDEAVEETSPEDFALTDIEEEDIFIEMEYDAANAETLVSVGVRYS